MRRHSSIFLTISAAAGLLTIGLAGCSNSPPGGGFTNGPPLGGDPSSPAVRSDLPVPDATPRSEMAGAGGAGDNSTSAGTGGKGGGQAGNPPAKNLSPTGGEAATTSPTGELKPAVAGRDGKAPESAAGGTKPAGTIQTGTPRSPQ